MIAVYKILNTATGEFYIGASVNAEQRWSRHKSDLRLQRHKNRDLQDAWNAHGAAMFTFHILETLATATGLEAAEQWHIAILAPAYNGAKTGRPNLDHGKTTRCECGLHSLHACITRAGLCKRA